MTELNEQQLARLAKLGKRNPSSSVAPSAATPPAPSAATMAATPSPVPAAQIAPPMASTAPADVNAQQAARLAKLGQRNPSSKAAAQPAAAHRAPLHADGGAPWSPPAGPPATAAAAASAAKIIIEPGSTSQVPVIDKHTSISLFGSRRRHVAAAGRILATGLATSGFLATIASLATADARAEESKQADVAPPTTMLETIHRVVYVDEFGN
ncbi:MAG: hypothetical protein QOE00_3001, partial [Ilumatobacteraceae bacterium]